MTHDDLISAVVVWLAAQTGLPVIRAYEEIEIPGGQYATVDLQQINPMNDNPISEVLTEVDDITYAAHAREYEYVFAVNIWRKPIPSQHLARIKEIIDRSDKVDLGDLHFIHSMGGVVNLNEDTKQGWLPRAYATLSIRGITETAIEADIIDQIGEVIIAPAG